MNRRSFLTLSRPQPAAHDLASHRAASNDLASRTAQQSGIASDALEPYAGPWNRSAVLHLLRRTVIAPTYRELREAEAMTMEALVDRLLAADRPLPAPSRLVETSLGEWFQPLYPGFYQSTIFFAELRRWWFRAMVNDGLSIRERMTMFWHNHFATNERQVDDSRFMYLQNQTFRELAVGSFKELVRRVTLDKAMLLFLNGRENTASTLNENYARELQELFTMGVADNDGNPNYSHDDIVAIARILTGWGWLTLTGEVFNNALAHDRTEKTLYGAAFPGGDGGPELARLMDAVFAKPETAKYVIRKLYRFFVYTDTTLTPVRPIDPAIESAIIEPLAAEFRSSGWSIAAVLRRLFTSRHFYEAANVGAMIKSPVDFLVSAVRATATAPLPARGGDYLAAFTPGDFAAQYLQQQAAELGQEMFAPPGVQGWQFYRAWISTTTLPRRRRIVDTLIAGAEALITDIHSLTFNGPSYKNGSWRMDVLSYARQWESFDDPGALVRDIAEHLLAYPASPELLGRLKEELVGPADYEWSDAPDPIRAARLAAMMGVLMRSSNFQLL